MKIPFFTQRQNRSAVTFPSTDSSKMTPEDIILHYHEQTKHHYYRFARSLGYLDWDNQPDPFRRFRETRLIPLEKSAISQSPSFEDLFIDGAIPSKELSFQTLSRFFKNSLAISAWKRVEDTRWSLRVNPSSGNLHPTEGYLILGDSLPELPAGNYHYAPREHALEQRAVFDPAILKNCFQKFPESTFLVGLSSIHWREAWKYGERAYRYCQHDVGHAIAAFRISAAVLGWKMVLLDELGDSDVAKLLGLNRDQDFEQAEDEHPDCIAAVFPSQKNHQAIFITDKFIEVGQKAEWKGKANLLSESHVEWEIVDHAANASVKPRTEIKVQNENAIQPIVSSKLHSISAEQMIQQRRSCLALDARTSISRSLFYSILSAVVPSVRIPFDCLIRSEMVTPRIHLAIFVNRVTDLDSGIYFLVRRDESKTVLKEAMNSKFLWEHPIECPEDLDLYLLQPGDYRRVASGVSCGQEIGGDGVFSLGMIAEMDEPVRNIGAWMYRRLFWEAGIIGQVLYLQAEAAGIRGTGIGCYFDDPMHELLGLRDRKFQDLYHFTMGGNVEDTRLTSEPAYP